MNPHKIRWTEETWNPMPGCTEISPGCRICYAKIMAHRLAGMPGTNADKYKGTTDKTKAGLIKWTGKLPYNEAWFKKPLLDKKGKMYFVNSMGDTFHEEHPKERIAHLFAVMLIARQHTFQVLTKRPDIAEQYLQDQEFIKLVSSYTFKYHQRKLSPVPYTTNIIRDLWPLRNVWVGTSVESEEYKPRIIHLRNTPAAIRFLSCEPLIGPITETHLDLTGIDQVIVRGESGHNASPMHPQWATDIRNACKTQDVKFFFKQWGSWLPWQPTAQPPFWKSQNGKEEDSHILFPDDWSYAIESGQWDDGLWCTPAGLPECAFQKVGKGEAGNMLDGIVYEEFPDKK